MDIQMENRHQPHSKYMVNLLKNRPHAVGVEIGLARGWNSSSLLQHLPNLKRLYCVDRWEHYPDCPRNKATVFEDLREQFFNNMKPYRDRMVILWMDSLEALKHIPNNSLDFVFIDANHKYEFVLANCSGWTPKVKKGGVISGHDYGNAEDKRGFGVRQAVHEYFGKENINVGINEMVWWLTK